MIDALYNTGLGLVGAGWWSSLAWPVIWNLIKIVVVVLPLMGAVAYLTLWERKAAWLHADPSWAPIVSVRWACCSRLPMP
jgi:hypothetical protein